jgi:cephalosporin hydroxylase
MDLHKEFLDERKASVDSYSSNKALKNAAKNFTRESLAARYSYNFDWLGRPIIQYPQDMVAVQELIWTVKPDLVIEMGIAHGGSLILTSSILALVEMSECIDKGIEISLDSPKGRVLAVDVDIREHNRSSIETHPMSNRITMIEGSSVESSTIDKVWEYAKDFNNVMVFLDSNHTHDHVLEELRAYAPLVSPQSYCLVFDSVVEDVPGSFYPDRPWGPGDNPKTALREYLSILKNSENKGRDGGKLHFENDVELQARLQVTVAPDGFLKRG